MKANSRTIPASKPKQRGSVDIFAAQCGKCFKWRVIPTNEEYEEIRCKFLEEPFLCHHKATVSCEDAADIDYDQTRIWAIDKPNIPKTPAGFKRGVTLRRDGSKMDCYYALPDGKKARTVSDVAASLQRNPKYKDTPLSDFNFAVPKVVEGSRLKEMKRARSQVDDSDQNSVE